MLKICQEAHLQGDVDLSLGSPVIPKRLLASLPNAPFRQLLIDAIERIYQFLAWVKDGYSSLYNRIVIFIACIARNEFIQTYTWYLSLIIFFWASWPVLCFCALYLITTLLWSLMIISCGWISLSVIWFCISYLMGLLLGSLTIFVDLRIESSPRGTHVWVKRRSPPSPRTLYRNSLKMWDDLNTLYHH
jgi:hypothetical protein